MNWCHNKIPDKVHITVIFFISCSQQLQANFFKSGFTAWNQIASKTTSCPDHGLRTPNETFYHWNPKFLGLGRRIGQINSGAFVVFLVKLSAPILVHGSMFSIIQPLILKKLSFYIHIPNKYLEFGFEFGPQRIRDLAFVCP